MRRRSTGTSGRSEPPRADPQRADACRRPGSPRALATCEGRRAFVPVKISRRLGTCEGLVPCGTCEGLVPCGTCEGLTPCGTCEVSCPAVPVKVSDPRDLWRSRASPRRVSRVVTVKVATRSAPLGSIPVVWSRGSPRPASSLAGSMTRRPALASWINTCRSVFLLGGLRRFESWGCVEGPRRIATVETSALRRPASESSVALTCNVSGRRKENPREPGPASRVQVVTTGHIPTVDQRRELLDHQTRRNGRSPAEAGITRTDAGTPY